MKRNGAHFPPESSASFSIKGDATLPSSSRLTLEGIRSLALGISQGAEGDQKARAEEIIREVDSLIEQVIAREAQVYAWASEE